MSFEPITRLRFWLTPGMGVKRHVAWATLGTVMALMGVALLALWFVDGHKETVYKPLMAFLTSSFWMRWGAWISLGIAALGVLLAIAAIGNLNRSLLSHWLPQPQDAAQVLHQRLQLAKGPRIVAFGGGTGLSNLLRGLRHYSSNLTAVVAVSDDGGSSGRLRDAFDMPAPGDIVDCIAALSDHELELSRLLEYRFERGEELQGHTFGNLFITTLTEVEGDFAHAIRQLNSILNLTGAVYPATTRALSLIVNKASGQTVRGETNVREHNGAVKRVMIEPSHPPALPEVLRDISQADLIVLGPGSLFTSVIPPLLVPEIKQALQMTKTPVLYICNIMTEAGETDDFSAFDHVAAIHKHIGRYPDFVVVNSSPVDDARLEAYQLEDAVPVLFDQDHFGQADVGVFPLALIGEGRYAQHDSMRLAKWLVEVAKTSPQTSHQIQKPEALTAVSGH